jgi:hypothetical protein
LNKKLSQNYELTEKLLHQNISAENIHHIRMMVDTKDIGNTTKLKALQRMQKEDEINDWLEQLGFTGNNDAGVTFADAGFATEDFEKIKGDLDKDSFIQVLQWLENLLSSRRIIKDLDEASTRISNLVGAIKSHVQMDRTNELQPTNIHTDIENTLTLLGYKLRD